MFTENDSDVYVSIFNSDSKNHLNLKDRLLEVTDNAKESLYKEFLEGVEAAMMKNAAVGLNEWTYPNKYKPIRNKIRKWVSDNNFSIINEMIFWSSK